MWNGCGFTAGSWNNFLRAPWKFLGETKLNLYSDARRIVTPACAHRIKNFAICVNLWIAYTVFNRTLTPYLFLFSRSTCSEHQNLCYRFPRKSYWLFLLLDSRNEPRQQTYHCSPSNTELLPCVISRPRLYADVSATYFNDYLAVLLHMLPPWRGVPSAPFLTSTEPFDLSARWGSDSTKTRQVVKRLLFFTFVRPVVWNAECKLPPIFLSPCRAEVENYSSSDIVFSS